MPISDHELLEYNKMGLIPGPDESETDFEKRVKVALALPLEEEPSLGKAFMLKDFIKNNSEFVSKKLFDIYPGWVPVYFSNYQLMPWQGGCAWFYQLSEEGPIQTCFQLRKQFAYSSKYLGLYKRDELISHESTHVGRMAFEEPKFEEVLAYQTAHSTFRKWVSPIIQSAKESLIFVIFLLVTMILEFLFLYFALPDTLFLILWMKLILCGLVIFGIGRLWIRQSQLKKCLTRIKEIIPNKDNALAFVYRLTDSEIILFSKSSTEEIKLYINNKKDNELRWKVITLAYNNFS